MIYRNTFPEFLESIAIGPNPSFLEKNTTYCEFVSGFPQEVELMYDWKAVKRSSDPLNALRNFTKKFLVYGPDLDTQTLKFFVQKVNNFPSYFSDVVKDEVISCFNEANKIKTPNPPPDGSIFITNHTSLDKDVLFLNKLAALIRSCKRPCNYFKPSSSSIGTLADFGRAMSDSASILIDGVQDTVHAATNLPTYVLNKVKPVVRTEFLKLKVLVQDLYTDGVKPFFSEEDRNRVKSGIKNFKTPDNDFMRLPLTGDTQTAFVASQFHSEFQMKLQQELGDCFRLHDYNFRYNEYDPTMNTSYSKRKFFGIKNGNVKSLVDSFGSLAPAQYVTENTYTNALDVPKAKEVFKYEDVKKTPDYSTYDGPSKGSESVITGGMATGNAIAATPGAGLENIPNTGKVYEFNYGEVKLTAYGYAMDECPDSGSEIGLGNRSNMIIPLKTIAVAPETLKNGTVKPGDVLILTCTDKAGNTFVERRQVGDSSGPGLLSKGGNYKFLIDEFQPNKKQYPSKLVGRSKDLKITIQVADTKEPLAKWNPQEASQFAPMFTCRTDWERVKKMGPTASSGFVKSKMDSEYVNYVKWSPDEPLNQKILNSKGC
jgi:hypothetical protein